MANGKEHGSRLRSKRKPKPRSAITGLRRAEVEKATSAVRINDCLSGMNHCSKAYGSKRQRANAKGQRRFFGDIPAPMR
jgi:hypothetical protein